MTKLLEIKEWLRSIYGKYSTVVMPILKFLLSLAVFLSINFNIGFTSKLRSPFLAIVLALICAFLPVSITVITAGILLVGHLYGISIEAALVGGILFLLMSILYFRFSTKDSYTLLLTPFSFLIHIPLLAPMVMGLIGTPISAIPVGCGVVLYYFVKFIKDKAVYLSTPGTETTVQKITYILEGILKNKEMLMTLVSFTAVIVIMYLIRRISKDYSWYIAIGMGVAFHIIIMLVGDFTLDMGGSIPGLFFSTLVSAILVVVIQFFIFSVDYSRSEYLQFEDDEYFYYVKAIPKLSISKKNIKVQRINSQSRSKNMVEKEEQLKKEEPSLGREVLTKKKETVKKEREYEE